MVPIVVVKSVDFGGDGSSSCHQLPIPIPQTVAAGPVMKGNEVVDIVDIVVVVSVAVIIAIALAQVIRSTSDIANVTAPSDSSACRWAENHPMDGSRNEFVHLIASIL